MTNHSLAVALAVDLAIAAALLSVAVSNTTAITTALAGRDTVSAAVRAEQPAAPGSTGAKLLAVEGRAP
jgi:hypothetical protein